MATTSQSEPSRDDQPDDSPADSAKPTKRSSVRKSPAKKVPAKKAARKEPAEGTTAPRAEAPKRRGATAIAAAAAQQLLALTGKDPEGITGLERTDDGWTVRVEVVEVRRIPDTTDVLALYEVEVDTDGEMTGYRRVRRYVRGVPGEE